MGPSSSPPQDYSESKRELRCPGEIIKVKAKPRGQALLHLVIYFICSSLYVRVQVRALCVPGTRGGKKRALEPWQWSCRRSRAATWKERKPGGLQEQPVLLTTELPSSLEKQIYKGIKKKNQTYLYMCLEK